MRKAARFLSRLLAQGIPAAVAIDKAFELGVMKPDTQRTRQKLETLAMSLAGRR